MRPDLLGFLVRWFVGGAAAFAVLYFTADAVVGNSEVLGGFYGIALGAAVVVWATVGAE